MLYMFAVFTAFVTLGLFMQVREGRTSLKSAALLELLLICAIVAIVLALSAHTAALAALGFALLLLFIVQFGRTLWNSAHDRLTTLRRATRLDTEGEDPIRKGALKGAIRLSLIVILVVAEITLMKRYGAGGAVWAFIGVAALAMVTDKLVKA